MNRQIYMRCLGERLRKLPKEDYDMAIEYFREYFDGQARKMKNRPSKTWPAPNRPPNRSL